MPEHPPPRFSLRFPEAELDRWAAAYSYAQADEAIREHAGAARARGYLTKVEFVRLAEWKSQRRRRLYATNDAAHVEEVTRIALDPHTTARLSIEILTLLAGVKWPTASVILHFCHRAPYPVLDFRALWSLRCNVPAKYDFVFWSAYTEFTRTLAQRVGRDMRTVDRALWEYSRRNQRRR